MSRQEETVAAQRRAQMVEETRAKLVQAARAAF
ncbi:MAG TPA: TetR/AcrR family transcriptional regulator, partial [Kiloniellaceae bacterium]|nr:TetR/AcrR family transcriptional regulator [Kiloniellaceae bacterium]